MIGYSDITALHALWFREGLLALLAPMLASDLVRPGHEADADAIFGWLQQGLRAGTVLAPELPADAPRQPGVAQGRLVGGNMDAPKKAKRPFFPLRRFAYLACATYRLTIHHEPGILYNQNPVRHRPYRNSG